MPRPPPNEVTNLQDRRPTQGIFIYLADVDSHYERAQVAGAEIVKPPEDLPYGRRYTARDPEGHPWFFTTPPTER